MANYPEHLLKVIEHLKKLPGVGSKSAERFAFDLLTWDPHELKEIGQTIAAIPQFIKTCDECGCLVEKECFSCKRFEEEMGTLCVVAFTKDIFPIERTRVFKGPYHVLGGVISPLDGMGPETLSLNNLKKRIQKGVKELIVALDSTLEGDTTALFLKEELKPFNLNYYRLAFGLPLGSSLDYIDGGTLARALSSKERF